MYSTYSCYPIAHLTNVEGRRPLELFRMPHTRHTMETVLYAPVFANRYAPRTSLTHDTSTRSYSIRRAALASQFAFQYMTMASLLAWRATCRDTHLLATKEIRHSLYALVARFFPEPRPFLRYLTRWRALVVSQAALSHVLHDPSVCEWTVELAVGNLVFQPFVCHMTRLLPFGSQVVSITEKPVPPSFPMFRYITRIAELRSTTGPVIQVYESATPSPCDVVCATWTTALMNFVMESSLGCAYPRLTLHYRGMLCDGRTDSRSQLDNATRDHLQAKGFEFAHYSTAWPSYSAGPYSMSIPSTVGCGKTLYVCPFQGRYFGDPGSLVVFFHEFFVDLDELRKRCVAPYGPMSVWRIPTKGTCEGRCVEDECVLPAFVISITLQFIEDRSTFVLPDNPFGTTVAGTSPTHVIRSRSSSSTVDYLIMNDLMMNKIP